MKTKLLGRFAFGFAAAAVAIVGPSSEALLADGSEGGLGAPSIAVAAGSGIVVAGTGAETQPAIINVNVPGTSVAQALLYWSGEGDSPGDNTIDVEIGAVTNTIVGDLIGGPTFFFNAGTPIYLTTYRADITTLISTGANTLSISEMSYTFANSGAGLLVIYDDGSTSEIDIRDGQDLAFAFFAPPLDATVPQVFNFAAADAARTATLSLFFGSVGAGIPRPTLIRTTADGEVTEYPNLLGSADGPNWDTLSLSVNLPAFATSVLVEAISWVDGTGELPASFNWLVGALSIPEPEACCRITGGGNDCAFDWMGDDCDLALGQMKKEGGGRDSYTFGGQCGAPGSPFGEWTHTNHNGPSGRFTFHAGTHSAPDWTKLEVVECSEPVCHPAMANGENAKIICEGVGTFKNADGAAGVSLGELYNIQIRIADYGEPGKGGKQPNGNGCPDQGFDNASSPDDCGCPDWYEIHIWNGAGFSYDVEGYIRGGNLQMHDCKD